MYNREEELERVLQDLLECFDEDTKGYSIETEEGIAYVSQDTEDAILRASAMLNYTGEDEDDE